MSNGHGLARGRTWYDGNAAVESKESRNWGGTHRYGAPCALLCKLFLPRSVPYSVIDPRRRMRR